ncbi:MAG: hypothetical protein U0841_11050 [Chloroflexia bacterium]
MVVAHLRLGGEEGGDREGREDDDHLGAQRRFQAEGVGEGPGDRHADRAGDEAEAEDEPGALRDPPSTAAPSPASADQ